MCRKHWNKSHLVGCPSLFLGRNSTIVRSHNSLSKHSKKEHLSCFPFLLLVKKYDFLLPTISSLCVSHILRGGDWGKARYQNDWHALSLWIYMFSYVSWSPREKKFCLLWDLSILERGFFFDKSLINKWFFQAYFITNTESIKFWEFVSLILEGLGYDRYSHFKFWSLKRFLAHSNSFYNFLYLVMFTLIFLWWTIFEILLQGCSSLADSWNYTY